MSERERPLKPVDLTASGFALTGAPLRVAGVYLAVGVLWILASDSIVNFLFGTSAQTQRFQLWKGMSYVAATALMLFLLVRRFGRRAADDLARLEASELKLLKLADEVPVALMVVTDRVIAQVNTGAATLLGDGTAASLVGRRIESFVVDEEKPGFEARLADAAGWDGETMRFTFRAVSGLRVTLELGVCESCIGMPGSLLICALNISKRRDLVEQLQQAQKEQLVGRIAAGIAHDFNNLITVILGYADLTRASLPDEASATRYLNELEAAGRQAAGVLSGMLTLARRDSTVRTPVAVGALVEDAVRLARGLLPGTIETKMELGGGADRVVMGDSVQLKQAILNLAANAGDAMPGGGTLSFEIVEVKPEIPYPPPPAGTGVGPARVRIAVHDTGGGIAVADIAHVFEPFFTTKPAGSGTGLGLAITKRIVDDHGGRIGVESHRGRGTTFTIDLPVAELAADEPAAGAASGIATPERVGRGTEDRSRSDAPLGRPLFARALVVEDDPRVRGLLEQWFRRLAQSCVLTTDAEGFKAAFEAERGSFDLLVIDDELPTSRGRQLIADVRAIRPDVSILFISGGLTDLPAGDPQTQSLAKPFGYRELAAALGPLVRAG